MWSEDGRRHDGRRESKVKVTAIVISSPPLPSSTATRAARPRRSYLAQFILIKDAPFPYLSPTSPGTTSPTTTHPRAEKGKCASWNNHVPSSASVSDSENATDDRSSRMLLLPAPPPNTWLSLALSPLVRREGDSGSGVRVMFFFSWRIPPKIGMFRGKRDGKRIRGSVLHKGLYTQTLSGKGKVRPWPSLSPMTPEQHKLTPSVVFQRSPSSRSNLTYDTDAKKN
jgi:hypothetical protein